MEQEDDDDKFHWAMSDPDADGNVWLHWTGPAGEWQDVMLGRTDQVARCMADWLDHIDFEK